MARRWAWSRLLLPLTVLVTVALVGAFLVWDARGDDEGGGGPPTGPPVSISIARIGGRRPIEVGTTIQIATRVVAAPATAGIELWDGGAKVGTVEADGPTFGHVWEWTASSPGTRVLLARATTTRGETGQSAPVVVRVTGAAGASPAAIAVSPIAHVRNATAQAGAPAVPRITFDRRACTLTAAGAGRLRWLSPGTTSFAPVKHAVAIPAAAGTHVFYAEDGPGRRVRLSPPVTVDVDTQCTGRHWTGELSLVDGVLIGAPLADPTLTSTHIYLSVDGDGFRRVPAQGVVTRGPAGFDFTAHLPALSGRRIDLEGWGRANGQLVELGDGRLRVPAGQRAGPLLGIGHATTLDIVKPAPFTDVGAQATDVHVRFDTIRLGNPNDSDKRRFAWTTDTPGATDGVWQASTVPFGSSTDLFPAGLFATQVFKVQQSEFVIDFAALIEDPPKHNFANELAAKSEITSIMLGQDVLVDVAGGLKIQDENATQSPTKKVPTLYPPGVDAVKVLRPHTLYVRMVTRSGLKATDASNVVTIHLDWTKVPPLKLNVPQDQPLPLPATVTSVEASPPRPPNPNYERCVRIVQSSYPFEGKTLTGEKYGPVGKPLCPDYIEPDAGGPLDWIANAIEWIAEVYDAIVDLIMAIKAKVVGVLAAACDAAPVPPLNKGQCDKLAAIAVDVMLASAGIPPTIPNFRGLVELAKGELSTAIASLAASQCPDAAQGLCQQAAAEMITKLIDDMEREISKAAVASANEGNWKLKLASGIRVVPEPVGQVVGSTVKVTAANPHDQPASLTTNAEVRGHVAKWTWWDCKFGIEVTKPVDGELFARQAVRTGPIPPKGSAVGVAVVDSFAHWKLPNSGCTGYGGYNSRIFLLWPDFSFTTQTVCVGTGACDIAKAEYVGKGPMVPSEYKFP